MKTLSLVGLKRDSIEYRRTVTRRYYHRHKKMMLKRTKAWRRSNRAKCRAHSIASYYRHVEKRRAYSRDYYRRNRKESLRKGLERRRLWRRQNPEKARQISRKEKYGITHDQFKRMLREQNNRCAVCRQKETMVDSRTGKVTALSIDHNHRTNKIRKLLCRRCNQGIGVFRESVLLLQRAIAYLSEERNPSWLKS